MSEKKVVSHLKVTINSYPTRVLISKSRRTKYFKEGDKKIPEKYKNRRYEFIPQKQGSKLVKLLTDMVSLEPIVKNPKAAGTERYQVINGNEMFARSHEQIRNKVVNHLKDVFAANIAAAGEVTFEKPVKISMIMRTQFGQATWDVDNMWIYHKCFMDALTDAGVIKNDNVIHVRRAGGTEFIPIREEETPSMEFNIFTTDDDPFSSAGKTFVFTQEGKAGEIKVTDTQIIISIGKKKVIYGAVKDGIRKAMFYCLNNFTTALIHRKDKVEYGSFFDCFEEHRIPVIILS